MALRLLWYRGMRTHKITPDCVGNSYMADSHSYDHPPDAVVPRGRNLCAGPTQRAALDGAEEFLRDFARNRAQVAKRVGGVVLL